MCVCMFMCVRARVCVCVCNTREYNPKYVTYGSLIPKPLKRVSPIPCCKVLPSYI